MYKCPLCAYSTKRARNLPLHMERKHGRKCPPIARPGARSRGTRGTRGTRARPERHQLNVPPELFLTPDSV